MQVALTPRWMWLLCLTENVTVLSLGSRKHTWDRVTGAISCRESNKSYKGKEEEGKKTLFSSCSLSKQCLFVSCFFLALVNQFFLTLLQGKEVFTDFNCISTEESFHIQDNSCSSVIFQQDFLLFFVSFWFFFSFCPCQGKSSVSLKIVNIHFGMTFHLSILVVSSKSFLKKKQKPCCC